MRTPKEQLIAVLERELKIAKQLPDDAKFIALRLQYDPNNTVLFHFKKDLYKELFSANPDISEGEIENVSPYGFENDDYDCYLNEKDFCGENFIDFCENNNIDDIVVFNYM